MAVLSAEQRKRMPSKEFGVAKGKRFPLNDLAHARNALARLNQAKGLSEGEKASIKKRAEAMIAKSHGGSYSKDAVSYAKGKGT